MLNAVENKLTAETANTVLSVLQATATKNLIFPNGFHGQEN